MPNTQSAKKQARQNEVRRVRNQARKTEIKTVVKKFDTALLTSDFVTAAALLAEAESKIARAGSKGVLHHKTVSRKVSRLTKRFKKEVASATAA
jgi:small subunit ribosomal protein S20